MKPATGQLRILKSAMIPNLGDAMLNPGEFVLVVRWTKESDWLCLSSLGFAQASTLWMNECSEVVCEGEDVFTAQNA